MMDLKKASRLWKKGYSMTQIGSEMGLTRGQVSGRISRNREMFPPRIDPIKLLEAEIAGVLVESIREDDEKAKARTSNALRKLFHEAQKPATPIPSKAESAEYDNSRLPYAQTLADLPATGCKWCLTDGGPFLMCAADRRKGKQYCEPHYQRAWRQT
jgi:GcrA cell cycle regulator